MRYEVRVVINGTVDAKALNDDDPKGHLEEAIESAIAQHIDHFEGEVEVVDVIKVDDVA
jgi:hypothetical protein